jgi:hypothetical protein
MKNISFITLILVVFIFNACSKNELQIDEFSLPKSEKESIVKMLETNLSIDTDTEINIESTELKKINDSYYLVSTHADKITTTLLEVTDDNNLVYAGISCTSVKCATTGGCIPDKSGIKCTPCEVSQGQGDCKKMVTSDLRE